ncbi:hypothetical protein EIQ13_20580 [Xanthomonas campestris pv. campestris]
MNSSVYRLLLIDTSESTIFHGLEMSRKPWAYHLSRRERGWGEGAGRSHSLVGLHEASPAPSSAPLGHLLPRGEGRGH